MVGLVIFCTVYIHAKYFLLFLQQRKLVLSQISLVTTGTASQPGGNVMGKKNVPTGQMNQKQHAVSSTKWWFSDMFYYQSTEKLKLLFPALAG